MAHLLHYDAGIPRPTLLKALLLISYISLLLPWVQSASSQKCRLVRSQNLVRSGGNDGSQSSSAPQPSTSSGTSGGGDDTQAQPGSDTDSGNGGNDGDDFKPFSYGKTPIRGVNLGGWLVLEPWITPSFFENTGHDDIIDEYTLGQKLSSDDALDMLTAHWQSWITEDDFKQISEAGLNHVRIPIGYWSVPLTKDDTNHTTSVKPYTPGAWPYFLKALNWARAYGIHVIVDIHGAPGSQNGYDNSGQLTSNPQWANDPVNIERTLDVIRFIVTNTGGLIDMIELLNEGAGFRGDNWAQALRNFFEDGYDVVRDAVGGGMKVMIGDGFLTVENWKNFLTSPAQGVFMDMHEYQIFSNLELERSYQDHLDFACSWIPRLTSYASSNLWTVIGEWSNAVTDCAKWLNGRNIGSRWDGTYPYSSSPPLGTCKNVTGSYHGWTDDYKAFLRKYWESQVQIGESIQGWVFWTWKAEQADEWSYQAGLEGGWIPTDPTDRQYPDICG